MSGLEVVKELKENFFGDSLCRAFPDLHAAKSFSSLLKVEESKDALDKGGHNKDPANVKHLQSLHKPLNVLCDFCGEDHKALS